jgi:hypothetical protein
MTKELITMIEREYDPSLVVGPGFKENWPMIQQVLQLKTRVLIRDI